jgi:hypothetical protein
MRNRVRLLYNIVSIVTIRYSIMCRMSILVIERVDGGKMMSIVDGEDKREKGGESERIGEIGEVSSWFMSLTSSYYLMLKSRFN